MFVGGVNECGYIPIAEFVPEETHRAKEALKILKKWNPRWAPTYQMTDYSDKLIWALQGTLP